jgi:lipoprotein-anchoring transpeptidase ErfK/SrfK
MKLAFFGLLTGVLLALTGCATHSGGQRSDLPPACLAACQRLDAPPTRYVLTVNIAAQKVSLFEDGKRVRTMPASTSRFGIGETENSNCTPLGLHCIAEKVGGNEPPGTVFREREVIGHTSDPAFAHGGITTRIMWLQGLDPGFNEGGNVDTHERTIYIHGTSDQSSLGKPASHGCIHLKDADLVKMFDLLPSGTLVWIAKN